MMISFHDPIRDALIGLLLGGAVLLACCGCSREVPPSEAAKAERARQTKSQFPVSQSSAPVSVRPVTKPASHPTVLTLAQLDAARPQQTPSESRPAAVSSASRAGRIAIEAIPSRALHVAGTEFMESGTAGAPLSTSSAGDAAALLRQAEAANIEGLRLASRQANFSAGAEFMNALRATAMALDARAIGSTMPAAHLADAQAALLALTEAEDFVARGGGLTAGPDVVAAVRSHRSGLLTEAEAESLSAAQAYKIYRDAACEKFGSAVAGANCGSMALHGLGKAMGAIAAQSRDAVPDARGKAEVFYEASLRADADNFPAANDLAVLLAEDGRCERAIALLRQGLAVSPQPALWNNLAAVHTRLGQHQLAAAARWEAQSPANSAGPIARQVVPTHNVQWVDPRTFAATARPNLENRNAEQSSQFTAKPSAAPAAALTPPPQQRAPVMTAQQPRRTTLVN